MILYFVNTFNNKKKLLVSQDTKPPVTLIVPAFNEQLCIEAKINNCFNLNYPDDKLQFIFITDGSTDGSNFLISEHSRIKLLFEPERKGKMAAVNRATQWVTTPIVIFSDANSLLNKDCINQIVQHYTDRKVGGVAGEKKIDFLKSQSAIGLGEGIYWKYESALKQLDSDFNSVVGAAGELFSMRTSLFVPQNENVILDDFILSMNICLQGYKVAYEPNAYAVEAPSADLAEERKRRVRIAAGAFQSLFKLGILFNIARYPLLSFQYISRRVCRWVFCPVALVVLYLSNAWLLLIHPSSLPAYFFLVQHVFYLFAFLGWLFYRMQIRFSWFFIPFYFVFMNVSLVQGFVRFITGSQPVKWDKSNRTLSGTHAERL